MTAQTNHYEALGLAREATPEEVKRAWARLVRVHTPDKDPDGNRRINEAKRILLDPQARTDYNALLDYGEEIDELFEEAQELEEAEDWSGAARLYKEILAFHPESHAARNRLALCLSYGDEDEEAARVLEGLVAKAPDSALYWGNLGRVLASAKLQPARAEQALRKAAELEPYNASHWIELSNLCRDLERYDEAERLIEQAVGADGKVDLDDLDALFALPLIYLFSKRLDKVPAFATRIQALVDEQNPEAAEFCAYRMAKIASELFDVAAFAEARTFVLAAQRLDPNDEKLRAFAGDVTKAAHLDEETDRLQADDAVLQVVRSLAQYFTDRYFRRIEDADSERIAQRLTEAVRTWSDDELRTAVGRLRSRYPAVYEHSREVYATLHEMGVPSRAPASTGGGSGGCGSVLAIFALLAFVSMIVSAVRG